MSEIDTPGKFLKVEDFFKSYNTWTSVQSVASTTLDSARKRIDLQFIGSDGAAAIGQLVFLNNREFRLRFSPDASKPLTEFNSRAIVLDTIDALQASLTATPSEQFTLEQLPPVPGAPPNDSSTFVTRRSDGGVALTVAITNAPFTIETSFTPDIVVGDAPSKILLWTTRAPTFYYEAHDHDDFRVVFTVNKPAASKYVGFGSNPGGSIVRNGHSFAFFNSDNFKMNNVYNEGPMNTREPPYHSSTFCMVFGEHSVRDRAMAGYFLDNYSQVCADVGDRDTTLLMLGTNYGVFDFYAFANTMAPNILKDFANLTGHARLKPRFSLGYHQGCYGWMSWGDIWDVRNGYRGNDIPLDGLHIDVDFQDEYHTFTVNQSAGAFPDPTTQFGNLRADGIKCSTNITPIISYVDADTKNYTTWLEGMQKGYFVPDHRFLPDDPATRVYQDFSGGYESNQVYDNVSTFNFNKGYPYIGQVNYGVDLTATGMYPDFGRKEVRLWWGTQYQALFDYGLEMVWQDMTTPSIGPGYGDFKSFPFRLLLSDDSLAKQGSYQQTRAIKVWNLYSYNLHKATYHGLNNLNGRKNKRNFIIGRGSATGMHRFAALWTGDNASTWDFYKINVAQVLSISMTGLPVSGEDIGGFAQDQSWQHWADPELVIRWITTGAFLPWFRNHYMHKADTKYFQEPYKFQDYAGYATPDNTFLYQMMLPITRYYIQLRYRLMQVFYDAMFENTFNGMPVTRPIFFNVPFDASLFDDHLDSVNNEFFVGPYLLVAPIMEPQTSGGGRRGIYLPNVELSSVNAWYTFMDNRKPLLDAVNGGSSISFDASISTDPNHIPFTVPLFVRAGGIVPTLEQEMWVNQRHEQNQANPITLNIYPGSVGAYDMFLDDGVSRSSARKFDKASGGDPQANDEYRHVLVLHYKAAADTRIVKITRPFDNFKPVYETFYFVAILHAPSENAPGTATGPLATVTVSNVVLTEIAGSLSPSQRADALAASTTDAFYYNQDINITFVKVFDTSDNISIELKYRPGSTVLGEVTAEPIGVERGPNTMCRPGICNPNISV
eukprot:TRINITY_DN5086_c0_g3_i1.p1 TRINITY_DN5086_c0_g3~~TRINITY_DN5086_c0_g3_i1.p1  ORF type:complete len:1057 (+),score=440.53 TRINITY_DN5086_c0_g3_i1:132-3302(+)